MKFEQCLDLLLEKAGDNQIERGKIFEHIVKFYLGNDLTTASEYSEVL